MEDFEADFALFYAINVKDLDYLLDLKSMMTSDRFHDAVLKNSYAQMPPAIDFDWLLKEICRDKIPDVEDRTILALADILEPEFVAEAVVQALSYDLIHVAEIIICQEPALLQIKVLRRYDDNETELTTPYYTIFDEEHFELLNRLLDKCPQGLEFEAAWQMALIEGTPLEILKKWWQIRPELLERRTSDGCTVLHLAVLGRNMEVVRSLIEEAGVDPLIENKAGRNAFFHSLLVYCSQFDEVLMYLCPMVLTEESKTRYRPKDLLMLFWASVRTLDLILMDMVWLFINYRDEMRNFRLIRFATIIFDLQLRIFFYKTAESEEIVNGTVMLAFLYDWAHKTPKSHPMVEVILKGFGELHSEAFMKNNDHHLHAFLMLLGEYLNHPTFGHTRELLALYIPPPADRNAQVMQRYDGILQTHNATLKTAEVLQKLVSEASDLLEIFVATGLFQIFMRLTYATEEMQKSNVPERQAERREEVEKSNVENVAAGGSDIVKAESDVESTQENAQPKVQSAKQHRKKSGKGGRKSQQKAASDVESTQENSQPKVESVKQHRKKSGKGGRKSQQKNPKPVKNVWV